MVNSLCCTPVGYSFISPTKPGMINGNSVAQKVIRVSSRGARTQSVEAKATTESNSSPGTPKVNSLICPDCDANGAKVCTSCTGSGVNSEDHFNGRFKTGEMCWLCRGKREMLCGKCNGAGFLGGFMNN